MAGWGSAWSDDWGSTTQFIGGGGADTYIDQSGAVFTPQVLDPQTVTDVSLIDQSGVVSAPKIGKVIEMSLINGSAAIITTAGGSAFNANLEISGVTGGFQADAFQSDAFYLASAMLADGSPQVFTPRASLRIETPSPVSAGSGEGFQADAFQNDAFQVGSAATGIDQSGAVFTPSQVLQSVAGEKTVLTPLIDQSGALFTPKTNEQVAAELIDQSGALFTPGGGAIIISFGGEVSWDSPGVLWDDPGVVWDSGGAGGGVLIQIGVVFTPEAHLSISTDLIDGSGVLFAPATNAKSVRPGLIDQSSFLYTPEGLLDQVLVDLIDQSPEMYDPKTGEEQYELIDQSPELYEPSINGQGVFQDDLLDGSAFVYGLEQIAMSVAPDLIDDSGEVFAPNAGPVIFAGLIDQSAEAFEPSLAIVVDIIDSSPQVFDPVNIFTNEPHTIRLDDDPSGFLDTSSVVFTPAAQIAPPKSVVVGIINGSPVVIGFRIVIPTQNIVLLRARYAPIIRNNARYDPVIDNDAMVSQQG